MFTITKEKNTYANPLQEIVCDKEEDIKDLPTNAGVGSTAFVIETSSVYMLNNEKVWTKI